MILFHLTSLTVFYKELPLIAGCKDNHTFYFYKPFLKKFKGNLLTDPNPLMTCLLKSKVPFNRKAHEVLRMERKKISSQRREDAKFFGSRLLVTQCHSPDSSGNLPILEK